MTGLLRLMGQIITDKLRFLHVILLSFFTSVFICILPSPKQSPGATVIPYMEKNIRKLFYEPLMLAALSINSKKRENCEECYSYTDLHLETKILVDVWEWVVGTEYSHSVSRHKSVVLVFWASPKLFANTTHKLHSSSVSAQHCADTETSNSRSELAPSPARYVVRLKTYLSAVFVKNLLHVVNMVCSLIKSWRCLPQIFQRNGRTIKTSR